MGKCKHNNSTWLINGGYGEWCYACGAYRGLEVTKPGHCVPRTRWVRPTGSKENNPYSKLKELEVTLG